MKRPLGVGLALSLVLLLAAANPATADRGGQPPEDAIGYWTAERVQNATPRDIVLDARGEVIPRPKPDKTGKPPKEGGGDDGETESTGDVKGAAWPDSSTDPVDDIVGKVLFTLGNSNYVCSASSVASSSGWVVLTAGHCAWDDSAGYATNWVFVPDYEDVLKFGCAGWDIDANGCYAASSLHASDAWTNLSGNDYTGDVAFAKMAASTPPPELGGVALPTVTKANAIGESVTAFGYPAAKKYSGSDLIYCAGTATAGPGNYAANAALACDMTGGSSGGPWYVDDGTGGRLAVSLNSFGLRGYNGFMFGPVFDDGALAALAAANAA